MIGFKAELIGSTTTMIHAYSFGVTSKPVKVRRPACKKNVTVKFNVI